MFADIGPKIIATHLWRAALVLGLLLALSFVVVAPPERCPSVGAGELRRSAQAAVDWLVRNQNPDGTWLYLYYDDDSVPPEYDMVRHTGAAMGLYRAAAEGLPRALRSADRGTAWALDRLRFRDDWAAVEYSGEVETGATALLVAGLVLRRQATADPRYDDVLRRLGRFLVGQVEPSGAVLAAYDPATAAPKPGEYSQYFTGETYWALTSLHRAFPGERWGAAADRVGNYLAAARDDREGHWPPIADHWAGYGLAATAAFPERGHPPLTQQEVDYARRQAGLFGGQVRWSAQRLGPWGALIRPGGVLRGGGYGVISEGLTGLWRASRRDPRLAALQKSIAERATCIAALAVRAQSDHDDAAGAARPDRVEGAWFRDGETRMDDQQHALAGLLLTIPIVAASNSSGGDGDPPSGWLWALALVLALNPVRAAFARPRPPTTAIGGLLVVAVAVAADPLLDALDVSDSSFRIAAGLVAVLTGTADLFRAPPSPGPPIPVVARPALLVIALGAGADQGVAVSVAGVAVGVAILTALVSATTPEGSSGHVLRWIARLVAGGLVVCGVALGLDGVWAV